MPRIAKAKAPPGNAEGEPRSKKQKDPMQEKIFWADWAKTRKINTKVPAEEQCEWLEVEDMGHVPKVNMDRDYRLVAISKKMSYFLRGGAFKDGKPHPPFRGIDLSVEFDALVRHLNDRIANVRPWEVMVCIRNNNTRRFRVMVGPPPVGEASWKGLPYQALRVRAVQ